MTRFDVFLSYRRKGGFETAKHLFDLLTKDGYKVCLDLDTLREGDFNKALLKRIDDCQDFILIVDAHAFDRSIDPDYDPKKDWLRQELAYALMRGKNVIPILLAGAAFPDNLPPDISQIAYKNGPSYSFEYFDSFYDKLKKFLHTKRASVRKIWLFSILGLLLLVGAILYFTLSGKSVDAPKKPAETPVVVPQNTPVSQPEIAPQPVTVQEQEPTPVNKEVDEPVVNAATAPQTVGSDKTKTVSQPVEKKTENKTKSESASSQSYSQTVSGRFAGHDYVDLGLSVMWATCNVGASKPSDAGQFFAWGETTAKQEFTWATYSFLADGTNKDNAHFSKYNLDNHSGNVDGLNKLEFSDDAANAICKDKWRMPTKDEFEELVNNCTWKWTKVDGIQGYVVTSNKRGFENNSIFLPAAGYYQKKSILNNGTRGCYWSASLSTHSHSACYLGFNSSQTRTYNEERYIGRSVRPVYKKEK